MMMMMMMMVMVVYVAQCMEMEHIKFVALYLHSAEEIPSGVRQEGMVQKPELA
jgi:hypothetical protein